jgi:hypothetical protein
MNTGLYKSHGGHFLIVTSVRGSKAKFISTRAGELQLHNTTEQRLREGRWEPTEEVPLATAIEKFANHFGGVSPAALSALLELKERNMDVKTATTKELVEFYNKHSETPVKKFKDRATAEARVQAVLDATPTPKAPVKAKKDGKDTVSPGGQRAVKVVVKQGSKESAPKEFSSVIKAFEELGLPRAKMSKFRKDFWAGAAKSIEDGKAVYEFLK